MLASKAPAPYHPSGDVDIEDDSNEEETMQPTPHERVKVTKEASAASKILNKLKQAKFDDAMNTLWSSIAGLVAAVAAEHGYKNVYIT